MKAQSLPMNEIVFLLLLWAGAMNGFSRINKLLDY